MNRLVSLSMRPLRAAVIRAYSNRLPPVTARETQRLADLRRSILNVPISKQEPASPFWSEARSELRRLIAHDDPRQFLQWPIIRQTMSAICPAYSWRYLLALKRRPDFHSGFESCLRRTDVVGNAVRYPFYPCTTADTIQRLFHIHLSWETLGIAPSEFTYICEFGGGYGELCRCFFGVGFRGHYMLYDFPELLCLQKYYLLHFGFQFGGADCPSDGFVTTHASLAELESTVKTETGKGLFVATWSLSEAPLALRDRIRTLVQDKFHAVLIAAQPNFSGYDNIEHFRSWLNPQLFESWIKPVPGFTDGSFYLFSRKR